MRRPKAMNREGRSVRNSFHPDEMLFRRIPPDLWSDPGENFKPNVASILLPDISVDRSSFSHPEWVRFDPNHGYRHDWGVLGIRVGDIPVERWANDSADCFRFEPSHQPLDDDYAHTEIRVYRNGNHATAPEDLPPRLLTLAWQRAILKKAKRVIGPEERVEVRREPPTSHEYSRPRIVTDE